MDDVAIYKKQWIWGKMYVGFLVSILHAFFVSVFWENVGEQRCKRIRFWSSPKDLVWKCLWNPRYHYLGRAHRKEKHPGEECYHLGTEQRIRRNRQQDKSKAKNLVLLKVTYVLIKVIWICNAGESIYTFIDPVSSTYKTFLNFSVWQTPTLPLSLSSVPWKSTLIPHLLFS